MIFVSENICAANVGKNAVQLLLSCTMHGTV
jgi:hypothetical protein